MLKKSILIIISFFSLACSNTDNQTKYVDRKAPKEKEEIVETVQREEKYYSDTSVLEDVAIQVIGDMLDLGLKILISTIIPGAFN
ncbi:hypothetical protein V3433_10695 [Fusobacterium polymorphum]|uniref:hypothetical protein n=1 Tax=Fusobacterium nucleatum subsp. polymorphum TaxID=76857 RepID=UPI001EF07FF3|nr:hypothetical protein [Fusobacterium nucleatum]MCG6838340.1 hypothetical protein [Fusobacterium nucleatum]